MNLSREHLEADIQRYLNLPLERRVWDLQDLMHSIAPRIWTPEMYERASEMLEKQGKNPEEYIAASQEEMDACNTYRKDLYIAVAHETFKELFAVAYPGENMMNLAYRHLVLELKK